MIRRLFCYIEYNKIHKDLKYNPSNFDLLELGATLYVEEEEAKTYARFVRPQHMELMTRERYLSFGGLKEFDLEHASCIEDISRRFYKTFYEYDLLVMWSRKDYEILMESLKRGGHIQAEHKPIFLEELIKMSKGYSKSFLEELSDYDIPIEDRYQLHYSKYKAKYLAKLYFSARKVYSYFLKKENYWFLKSCYGSTIHQVDCAIAKEIPIKNVREARMSDVFDGYQACSKCCKGNLMLLADKFHVRYPKHTQFQEKQIEKMCRELGLEYSLTENIIFIKTQYSNWRLLYEQGKVTKVYHENLRRDRREIGRRTGERFHDGFHQQQIAFDNLYDVLYYIHTHERDFFRKS